MKQASVAWLGCVATLVGLGMSCHGSDPAQPSCVEGALACSDGKLSRCDQGQSVVTDDCPARNLTCAPTLLRCTPCIPDALSCAGFDVTRCSADGQTQERTQRCDADQGTACRDGACVNLCAQAVQVRSNIGCEYWAVDLDNAVVASGNAAEQQYAVVLSNVEPDLVANVTIEEDTASPGQPATVRTVATARVNPRALEVFKLGPKEVDGSPPGLYNQGTGTALSRGAYRIRSDVPIVVYQFNPFENANVFSNDASILLPTSALGNGTPAYVVAAWPQTIAKTDVRNTNFDLNLRTFLTIVGTQQDTLIHVKSSARIIPGGPLSSGVVQGGEFDVTLQPFDVLNLETGDFNADFTGSVVSASAPIGVFVGSEASDAPYVGSLESRACCADHLEEQLVPLRAVGKRYAISRMPNRTRAVASAGGATGFFDEPEFYRVVATATGTTHVTTTLPAPLDAFELDAQGTVTTLTAYQDFVMTSDQPLLVADVQASQEAAGVDRTLPGGDPSLTFVPPIEQWRSDYVLLTPDKYAFDFLVIAAPYGAAVYVDGLAVDGNVCEFAAADGLSDQARGGASPPYVVYRCQLSFPVIDPQKLRPDNILPGRQNDGVHRVQSDLPVGVLVYGFDSFVSYAYAGGTDLRDLTLR